MWFLLELKLLFTVNGVPSSQILSTLKMEAICSSEKSVLTRSAWRHLHNHCHENLKSYINTIWQTKCRAGARTHTQVLTLLIHLDLQLEGLQSAFFVLP
jgi:hypothetical protein